MNNNLHVLQLRRNKLLPLILKQIYFLIKTSKDFQEYTKIKGFFYNQKYPNLLFIDIENIAPFFEIISPINFINIKQNKISAESLGADLFKKEIIVEQDLTINIGDKVEFTTGKQKKQAIVKEFLLKQKIAKVSLINTLTNYPFLIQIPIVKLKKI